MERLQKYMASCGIASRRRCEEIIMSGRVKVNGKTIKELGTKIDAKNDKVTLDGKYITCEEKKIYIALNKPKGYVCTVSDEKGRKTVLDLVKVKERIYPVGRLDYDTTGLLLMTNDGEIYNNIIHPRKSIDKVYEAKIVGIPNEMEMDKFKNGIVLDERKTSPANITIIRTENDCSVVSVTIHEGRNRQVRRMCEAIGHPVIELNRVSIGNIKLKELQIGKWRYLYSEEIAYLKTLQNERR